MSFCKQSIFLNLHDDNDYRFMSNDNKRFSSVVAQLLGRSEQEHYYKQNGIDKPTHIHGFKCGFIQSRGEERKTH